MSIEIVMAILILIQFLAIFKLGFLGRFFANSIRFFVGDLFIYAGILGILASIGVLFRGRIQSIPKKWIGVATSLIIASFLWVEVASFSSYVQEGGQLFKEMMARYAIDFKANAIEQNLGSGMIGALFYTITYFLVSQWGTYLTIFVLFMIAIFVAFEIHLKDVFEVLRNWTAQIQHQLEENKVEKDSRVRETKPEVIETKPKEVKEKKASLIDKMKNFVFDEEEEEDEFEEIYPEVTTSPVTKTVAEEEFVQPKREEPTSFNPFIELTEVEEDTEDLEDFVINGGTDDSDYQLPPLTLLNPIPPSDQSDEKMIVEKNLKILERTFESFGVEAKVMPNPLVGPAVTKFEIKPAIGVKVSKIVNLSDDIALALAAKDIRIEAPIPGKPFVGIEVPNSKTSFVAFSDVIQAALQSPKPLDVPLGRDISGNVRLCDISKMPHLLIAGSTGSGKSVCINGIITSILMKTKPHEVKLMMIDPKMVELNGYNGIPHLLTPVVTNPRKAAQALKKVVTEMEKRYEMFAAMGMKNIDGYNAHVASYNAETGEENPLLPYIVVIVDELADLMMVASNEVEDAIIRLAQMARAAGIHMILATQRPSVDVITGIIKANVPSRIAFAVSSGTDSRTIIDSSGAEKLLGRGDMLYIPMGENKPIRVQGAYLTDEEVERIVEFVKTQQEVEYDETMMLPETPEGSSDDPEDDLFYEVLEMIRELETISTSYIQRRFKIGFNRAARLIEELEARGYVGPSEGSKPRKVNVDAFDHENDSQNPPTT
ncbi:DNA translocase FtsK [uncultured Granulicatella sp.]|uniref:DNA translocase FtsK n=1 Tax=uncultured Granulicatella sp. TaxID=316089 RepID=UPI0028D00804|nr:DNA translocase FtsK [uncultured Granulicatella sp.]